MKKRKIKRYVGFWELAYLFGQTALFDQMDYRTLAEKEFWAEVDAEQQLMYQDFKWPEKRPREVKEYTGIEERQVTIEEFIERSLGGANGQPRRKRKS